ncbi:MAG: hypothetical protein ABL982_14260, partial [Vicinamibacterales bacterium]
MKQHGEDIRYAPFANRWLVWDGQRWTRDETGDVARRAKATVRSMLKSAADLDDGDARTALIKWAVGSESASRLAAMDALARTEFGVAVDSSELDRDPYLFNVANGTIDLRTGELHQADRNDLITKRSSVRYQPGAKAPTWRKFLARVIPDKDLRDFLQRAVGYSLFGLTSEQVAFLLYGHGANGKSTFLVALRAAFGD